MTELSTARAVVIVVLASLLAAGILAIVSRAPAGLRTAEPPPGATDADHGASFSDQQVRRHAAYRGPAYLFLGLTTVIDILVLIVLARGPFSRFVNRLEGVPGGWIVRATIAVALLVIVMWVAALPLNFVRGFAMDRAWGLSTQGLGGWLSDQLRATGVGLVVSVIAALAFLTVVRWQPKLWWLIAWAAFTALFALMTLLWPVLIAPLFNKFTPLQDQSLKDSALGLARDAGVEIQEVLVADASRRTSTENAYVAGFGATARLVLYDNLVENSTPREAAFVIAHELGHRAKAHLLKQVVLSSVGLLIGFALLRYLTGVTWIWQRTGARGIQDVAALPVLLLFALVLGFLSLPIQNAISRQFESQADAMAISLTHDPATAVSTFRRLAFSNLADLKPPALAVDLLFSHPPIPQRIRSVLNAGSP